MQIDSHEKSLSRGRLEIAFLADQLQIRPRDEAVEVAHRFYKLALQRNFTRGRRTNQVCLSGSPAP
jgi:transcription factor IIIB 90 kDa subunit